LTCRDLSDRLAAGRARQPTSRPRPRSARSLGPARSARSTRIASTWPAARHPAAMASRADLHSDRERRVHPCRPVRRLSALRADP
jgi:hypothetical protein